MYKTVLLQSRSTYWTNRESQEELIVDSVDLTQEIERVCNELAKDGFEVVQLTPVTSGSMSNGNGYFQTASMIILAKKIQK
jgi:hypothetical protein